MVDKAKITSVGIPKYMKKIEKPAKEVNDSSQVRIVCLRVISLISAFPFLCIWLLQTKKNTSLPVYMMPGSFRTSV